jgi:hypothetical protein
MKKEWIYKLLISTMVFGVIIILVIILLLTSKQKPAPTNTQSTAKSEDFATFINNEFDYSFDYPSKLICEYDSAEKLAVMCRLPKEKNRFKK